MMCEFCDNTKTPLQKTCINYGMVQWLEVIKFETLLVSEYELGVIIDRGYLRLTDIDDCGCLDHRQKVKINFCSMCGEELK